MAESFNNTLGFEVVFGINEGYSDGFTNFPQWPIDKLIAHVSSIWQMRMEQELMFSRISVGGVVTVGQVAYAQAHGSPIGGEQVIIVKGQMHPGFVRATLSPMDALKEGGPNKRWMDAVTNVVRHVKTDLRQARVQLIFFPITALIYLEDE